MKATRLVPAASCDAPSCSPLYRLTAGTGTLMPPGSQIRWRGWHNPAMHRCELGSTATSEAAHREEGHTSTLCLFYLPEGLRNAERPNVQGPEDNSLPGSPHEVTVRSTTVGSQTGSAVPSWSHRSRSTEYSGCCHLEHRDTCVTSYGNMLGSQN